MTEQERWEHRPVLLQECIQWLAVHPQGIYVDGTLGRAGHSQEIAKRLTTGRLIGLDRDEDALEQSRQILSPWLDRVTLVHSNFAQLDQVLDRLSLPLVDGVLLDLGVSSPQLDEGRRGFSYQVDGPLDMRMDQREGLTGEQVVNHWPQEELQRILFQYGEERYARQIAGAVVRRRQVRPIQSTLELVEVIQSALPGKARWGEQHPARRTFQAIRIAVNDELRSVEVGLQAAMDRLRPGGRLVVLTFHSLEDRIVKAALAQSARGCICPPRLPVCVCGQVPQMRVMTKKPLLPSPQEVAENRRARSAKLRVGEKLGDPPGGGGPSQYLRSSMEKEMNVEME